MSLIDTFLFNGEWDMLLLRLRTLDEIVDRFVLVESTTAFSGIEKALTFTDPPAEFDPWLSRITYVKVTDEPVPGANAWRGHPGAAHNAASHDHQIDAMARGVQSADDDDVVLVAGLDEIPDPRDYARVLELLDKHAYVTTELRMYVFWLNAYLRNRRSALWMRVGTIRARPQMGLTETLHRYGYDAPARVQGGWHFTWIGPYPRIAAKLGQMLERVWDCDEYRARMRRAYDAGVYRSYYDTEDQSLQIQAIDETFPLPLQRDPQRWAHMIKGVG